MLRDELRKKPIRTILRMGFVCMVPVLYVITFLCTVNVLAHREELAAAPGREVRVVLDEREPGGGFKYNTTQGYGVRGMADLSTARIAQVQTGTVRSYGNWLYMEVEDGDFVEEGDGFSYPLRQAIWATVTKQDRSTVHVRVMIADYPKGGPIRSMALTHDRAIERLRAIWQDVFMDNSIFPDFGITAAVANTDNLPLRDGTLDRVTVCLLETYNPCDQPKITYRPPTYKLWVRLNGELGDRTVIIDEPESKPHRVITD